MATLVNNSSRLLIALVVYIINSISTVFAADLQEEKAKAYQSFVTLTISPASKKPTEDLFGSGVIIDDEGHVLTACHVVKQTLDEGWQQEGNLFMQTGSNINAQFIDNVGNLRTEKYAVDVLSCEEKLDVAVVQLRDKPIEFDPDILPIFDKEASYKTCSNCLEFLGYPGHFEDQSGNSVRVENLIGQITADLWHGFSGGPIYFKGDGGVNEWYLTGITIAGDTERSTTKYMANYWAFDRLLGGFRERLKYTNSPSEFECSYETIKSKGSSFVTQNIISEPKEYVSSLNLEQINKLARIILNENCSSQAKILWVRTLAEAVAERFYSELIGQPSFINTYFEIIDKLISFYQILDAGEENKMRKWREYNSALYNLCLQEKSQPTKCWIRVLRSNERLWNWVVKDKIKNNFWITSSMELLKEWGDILYKLAFLDENEEAQTDDRLWKSILYLDSQWRPEENTFNNIPKCYIGALALDKYSKAYNVLQNKKKKIDNEYWLKSKKDICTGINSTIDGLTNLCKDENIKYFERLNIVKVNNYADCKK